MRDASTTTAKRAMNAISWRPGMDAVITSMIIDIMLCDDEGVGSWTHVRMGYAEH